MASARPANFIPEAHPGTTALANYRAKKLQTTAAIVQHAVQSLGHEPTASDVRALAKITKTAPDTIRTLIDEAKTRFVSSIADYVDIHKSATQDALANGDNEVAIKAAQWAIEKTSHNGASIIERDKAKTDTGTKIMIGIRLGGQRNTVEGALLEPTIIDKDD